RSLLTLSASWSDCEPGIDVAADLGQGLAADVSNVLFLPPANATKRSDCRHFFGWAQVCEFSCNSELKSPSKSGRVSGCRATDICRPVRPRCGTVRTYQYSCFSNQPASSSYYA